VAFGIAGGLVIGFARVSVGAHWLSDALWAWPVTMACGWVVWLWLRRVYPVEAASGSIP
jgi:lipid A 4'-phosphatase